MPNQTVPDQTELRGLLKSIRRIARALDVQSRRIDREIGLTLPQLIVLQCVRDLGEVTSRAISAEADLSPPTVVGVLDKLEAKGLIERYRSAIDRRVVHTRLTEAGERTIAAAPSALGETFERCFSALPDVDRRSALEHLEHLGALFDRTVRDPAASADTAIAPDCAAPAGPTPG